MTGEERVAELHALVTKQIECARLASRIAAMLWDSVYASEEELAKHPDAPPQERADAELRASKPYFNTVSIRQLPMSLESVKGVVPPDR